MSGDHADDDEPTANDLPEVGAPSYDHAPATLEMRPSPFHPMSSATPTAPGMPSPVRIEPVITHKPDVVHVAPVILNAPESDLAGPTDPDGYALESGETDPHLAPWYDAGPTDVSGLPRILRPQVPPPDAPKIEISQSLQLDSDEVQTAVRAAKAKTLAARKGAKRPLRRHVPQEGPGPAAPTYQMLPALKRKQAKEGSDLPLILGLAALALLIAGLVGAGAYFAVRSAGAAPAAQAAP